MKTPLKKAFTLIEVLIVVAIVGIIIGIAVPAMNSARQDGLVTASHGQARTMNNAKDRAILAGQDNPVLHGNDLAGAAAYLIDLGYLQQP